MPSLPTDNSRKAYSTDAFRRYLPSKYVKDYDTDGASNASIACHFCKFCILLWIWALVLLFPTWLTSYFKANDIDSFETGNVNIIQHIYLTLIPFVSNPSFAPLNLITLFLYYILTLTLYYTYLYSLTTLTTPIGFFCRLYFVGVSL